MDTQFEVEVQNNLCNQQVKQFEVEVQKTYVTHDVLSFILIIGQVSEPSKLANLYLHRIVSSDCITAVNMAKVRGSQAVGTPSAFKKGKTSHQPSTPTKTITQNQPQAPIKMPPQDSRDTTAAPSSSATPERAVEASTKTKTFFLKFFEVFGSDQTVQSTTTSGGGSDCHATLPAGRNEMHTFFFPR